MAGAFLVKLELESEEGKIQDQDPEVEEKGSHQETSLKKTRGSSQETKRGFPGSSKQEVKNQDPQEEAEGPTERDQVGSGPAIGQDLDRQDSQPGPRRFTSSLERLHGREVACRTIGAHGRLQDVLVPVGALEDPARRRYFKNMAEQSWRRHYFLERREEIERGGGFKGPGEFRLPALEPIPPMPLAMWPHGDASEPGSGSGQGSQEGGSSSSAMRRASAAGLVHLGGPVPIQEGDTILEISKHKGNTRTSFAGR